MKKLLIRIGRSVGDVPAGHDVDDGGTRSRPCPSPGAKLADLHSCIARYDALEHLAVASFH